MMDDIWTTPAMNREELIDAGEFVLCRSVERPGAKEVVCSMDVPMFHVFEVRTGRS